MSTLFTRITMAAPLALLGLAPASSLAAVYTLQGESVTQDVTISKENPNQAYDTTAQVGNLQLRYSEGNRSSTLMRFDLPSLALGESITDATLTVEYFANTNGTTGAITVDLYRVLVPWVEDEATWNDRATGTPWNTGTTADGFGSNNAGTPVNYDPQSLGSIELTAGSFGLVSFIATPELLGVLNDMAHGAIDNYGFVLWASAPAVQTTRHLLVSSERTGDVFHPELELVTVVPEPAALALLSIAGSLLLVQRRRA